MAACSMWRCGKNLHARESLGYLAYKQNFFFDAGGEIE
jgi:hypothetical protein